MSENKKNILGEEELKSVAGGWGDENHSDLCKYSPSGKLNSDGKPLCVHWQWNERLNLYICDPGDYDCGCLHCLNGVCSVRAGGG